MPEYPKYQDYVIRDGKLVGEFEQMYRDFEDPWEQTTRERFASEKAVALNLLSRLRAECAARTVIELGCGVGDFTGRIAQTGLNTIGLDISETAISRAKARVPAPTQFVCGRLSDHELIKRLAPDVIVMAEITWYVLEELPAFLAFMKRHLPEVYLIHLLMTYPPGIQRYGREYFTNLDEIKRYFGLDYIESGLVHCEGGARTWFLARVLSEPQIR